MRIKGTHYLLALLFALCFAACGMMVYEPEELEEDKKIGDLIAKLTTSMHYNELTLDDEFSKKVFEQLLKYNDPNKRFLLASDVERLKKYELQIDEFYVSKNLSLFEELLPIVEKREQEVIEMVKQMLEKPIVFSGDETVETDPDKYDFCESEKARKLRWKKDLAYRINDKVFHLKKTADEDTTLSEKPSLDSLEIKAREQILKQHKEWFSRLEKLEKDDRLSTYFNAILSVYGPHTQFYPPKKKEDFDIGFSGKLEGIGATLSVKEGYITVEKIVPGSASWKAGDLEAGDRILEVAQGDSTPIDVFDMRLDKAVRLIRGPKGTEVRLTIKKVSDEVEVISIIRDVVIIEETYAKSLVITDSLSGKKMGYIDLESFYADFNNRNGRRCSKDVLAEIKALKKEDVSGIILDLRDNGGGSLTDAIEMAGYFIKVGPIVQVDGVGERPKSYSDINPLQQFSGNLIVMINGFSASASEIFAAAIQDYERGIIIGSNSYGKGTVQRFMPLTNVAQAYNIELASPQIGEVKQTIAKFFRINGGATQLKGVAPDIHLPDRYVYMDLGEGSYDHALPWKSISPADYKVLGNKKAYQKLAKEMQEELKSDKFFNAVDSSARTLKELRDQSVFPLEFAAYTANKKDRDERAKKFEFEPDSITDWTLRFHSRDSLSMVGDSIVAERMNSFRDGLLKDMYIKKAVELGARMQ